MTSSNDGSKPRGGLLNILLQQNSKRKRLRPSHRNASSDFSSSYIRNRRKPFSRNQVHHRSPLDNLDQSSDEVVAAKHHKPGFIKELLLAKNDRGFAVIRETYKQQKKQARQKADKNRNGDSGLLRDVVSGLSTNKRVAMAFVYLDLFVDCFMCAMYLHQIAWSVPLPETTPQWLFITRLTFVYDIAVALSIYNLVSFALRILLSADIMRSLMSVHPLIDLVTAVPFVVSLGLQNGRYLWVPYFLRCWYIIWRIKRVLGVEMDVNSDEGEVQTNPLRNQLLVLAATVVAILFTAMSAFQWAEMMFGGTQLGVIDSIYFTMVTSSTIGYGDISPSSWVSKVIVIGLIFVILGMIPALISDVIETYKLNRESSRSFMPSNKKFFIIMGDFSNPNRVQDLLTGFLNLASTNKPDVHLLVVGDDSAPMAVQSLLSLPFYKTYATYLQASPLNEQDFTRMKSRQAAAAFVLSNRDASDWLEEDEHKTLWAWSFHIYNPHVPLYTQVLLPETVAYQQIAHRAVCIDQVNQALLASNCLHHGSATLLINLVCSSKPSKFCVEPWEFQYSDGMSNEIYHAPIRHLFVGRSFAWCSWYLFTEYQVILIAVKTYVPEIKRHRILLNPAMHHEMKQGDIGFYIAQDETDIRAIDALTEDQFRMSLKLYKDQFNNDSISEIRVNMDDNASVQTLEDQDPESAGDHPTKKSEGVEIDVDLITPLPRPESLESLASDMYVGRPDAPYTSTPCEIPGLCYLLKLPRKSVDDCLLEDAGDLKGHWIVYAGQEPLFRFMCTLRSARIIPPDRLKTVLVMGNALPSSEDFETNLAVFPFVHFMVGDCRRRRDWIRANIKDAEKVLVMSKPENAFDRGSTTADSASAPVVNDTSPSYVDAAAIMSAHVIQQVLAPFALKVDTVQVDPSRLPDMGGRSQHAVAGQTGYGLVGPLKQLVEKGAVGNIKGTEVNTTNEQRRSVDAEHLEASESQAQDTEPAELPVISPEKYVITVLMDRKNIRFLHALQCSTPMVDHLHSPTYASGQVIIAGLLENVLHAVYRKPHILDLLKLLCGEVPNDEENTVDGGRNGTIRREPARAKGTSSSPPSTPTSFLTMMRVGSRLAGKTFGWLYKRLALEHGIIPIGIYRAPDPAVLGNAGHPFVYTNPLPAVILNADDQIYILQPDART